MSANVRVSIVMPTYKLEYFEDASTACSGRPIRPWS